MKSRVFRHVGTLTTVIPLVDQIDWTFVRSVLNRTRRSEVFHALDGLLVWYKTSGVVKKGKPQHEFAENIDHSKQNTG